MSDPREMFYGAPSQIFKNAKQLRDNATKHEKLLWEHLSGNKILGLRFKRQHPVARYIADFYCHKLKLVIEIDGQSHDLDQQKAYDQIRTEEMEGLGITVVRFTNEEVEKEMSKVIQSIKDLCEHLNEKSDGE